MSDESDDEALEAAVDDLSPASLSQLRQLLRVLEVAQRFGHPSTGIAMPLEHAPIVDEVRDWLHANRLIAKTFDWPSWEDGRSLTPQDIPCRPVADAVRVMTSLVRNDRFCGGALVAGCENGLMQASLRQVLKHHSPPSARAMVTRCQ